MAVISRPIGFGYGTRLGGSFAGKAETIAAVIVQRSGVSKSRYLRRHLKGYDPEPESVEPVVVEKRKKKLKIPKIEIEAIDDALGPLGPVKAITLEHEIKFGPRVGEHKIAQVEDDDDDFLLMSVL